MSGVVTSSSPHGPVSSHRDVWHGDLWIALALVVLGSPLAATSAPDSAAPSIAAYRSDKEDNSTEVKPLQSG